MITSSLSRECGREREGEKRKRNVFPFDSFNRRHVHNMLQIDFEYNSGRSIGINGNGVNDK